MQRRYSHDDVMLYAVGEETEDGLKVPKVVAFELAQRKVILSDTDFFSGKAP